MIFYFAMDFFIPTAFAQNAASTAETTHTASSNLSTLFSKGALLVVLLGITVGLSILAGIAVKRAIQKRTGDTHKELVILYGRIAFTLVAVVGALISFIIVGFDLQLFSGALGLGLGLAVRGVLENYISGIIILTQDRFNIGDIVEIGGNKGTIVDVTGRAISLKGFDGEEITIPNSQVLTGTVTCLTKNPVRRHKVTVSVAYGTNIAKAKEVLLALLKKHPEIEPVPAPAILVGQFGGSAIDINITFWTVSRGCKWWVVKSDITHEAYEALGAAGIEIPYNIQTLRVDDSSSDLLASFMRGMTPAAAAASLATPETPIEVTTAETVAATPEPEKARLPVEGAAMVGDMFSGNRPSDAMLQAPGVAGVIQQVAAETPAAAPVVEVAAAPLGISVLPETK